ncbi:MAG: PhnD/SsuA/transferrin family substrate-binding protein [Clostridium sp.]|uniref:phosphate/phosphite/phosphonate ABC transporter substrate-binding protein n=1 Tax=Clostridium sp. DSM 8431 TaxID=1761781 RepID=UPI0008ED8E17|nr:PhnD/SsuA/transferrin family substrate-binding protein [Clostridium sp. DSM 8431]MCR4945186.1 PhnD/SsuA/transferrin family substrate-binding protein [Clostridium sp.]SFU77757.1 phosphonate transport system substrate-binding protein [Clostridium sp. DSM 8431]
MKKIITFAMAIMMTLGLLTGCGSNNKNELPKDLVVYFVPSRDADEIVTATEPLKALLKDELNKQGYEFDDINIEVGTSFEAVGESLTAGTAHVGFIPGGTYVLYDDGADAVLTATRNGLSKDSENPADWNDGKATEKSEEQVTYYKALAIAGPSAKGQELAAKVNSGEELTTEDMKSAKIGVMSSSSPAGYIYPSLWLNEKFGLNITDIPNVVQNDSYGSAITRLASGQLDVIFAYADVRSDYENKWTSTSGKSIWEDTNIIGVMDNIYNDTISVSKNVDFIDDDFIKALQTAFINIASTDEGKNIISIYQHNGYQVAEDANYDSERNAQELVKKTNK